MKTVSDIYQLFLRELWQLLRNPIFLFMGVFTPLLYLTLFAPILKNFENMPGFTSGNVLTTFIPGMFSLIAFSGGLFAGFGVIDELRNGILERMRVTPCSRFALMAGPVFRDVLATLGQITIFMLIALPFGFRMNPSGIAPMMLLLALLTLTTSSFGNAMGLIAKSEDHYAPLVHGINLPVILLSGMMLPMALAPKWLQIVAHFNPVYHVVEAARHLVVGEIFHPTVMMAFAFMTLISAFMMWFSTRTFSKAVY